MINNNLKIQWHELLTGTEHHGSHNFRFLLACDYDESDLNDLFQYYDCRDELVKRLMASKNMTRPQSVSVCNMKSLVRQDLLSKWNLVQSAKDLGPEDISQFESSEHAIEYLSDITAQHLETVDMTVTHDWDEYLQRNSQESMNNRIEKVIVSYANHEGGFYDTAIDIVGYSALKEAFYGAESEYLRVLHFMAPFTQYKIDFTADLLLSSSGSSYVLDSDGLLLYLDPRIKITE